MAWTTAIGGALLVVGAALLGVSVYQLGVTRAVCRWQVTGGRVRLGRFLATVGVLSGVLAITVGVGVLVSLAPIDGRLLRPVLIVAASGVTLVVTGYIAAKVTDRVELNTLIRTPARFRRIVGSLTPVTPVEAGKASPDLAADSVIPPVAQPGWVYRDARGGWFLVVGASGGHRLVSLPDFHLTPVGAAQPPVTAVGSVELAVWPLGQTPSVREGEASVPS